MLTDFSVLHTAEDKIKAAELSFVIDRQYAWEHLYSSVGYNGRSLQLVIYRHQNIEGMKSYNQQPFQMEKYILIL